MHLTPIKSVEISKDIGEFIAKMELDSVKAIEYIEQYRRDFGVEEINLHAMCEYLLDQLLPEYPSQVITEGTTVKTTLYAPQISKTVITMEGGIIQNIMSDMPLHALVVDFDIDGVEDDDVKVVNGDDCTLCLWDHCVDAQPYHIPREETKNVFKQYYNQKGD